MRATGANYSRMTEMITPYNRALTMPGVTGAWDLRYGAGPCQGGEGDHRQAAMIGYLNAFTMYTATSALAVVFALMVRRRQA